MQMTVNDRRCSARPCSNKLFIEPRRQVALSNLGSQNDLMFDTVHIGISTNSFKNRSKKNEQRASS
jgi:hypothetical protein